MQNDGVWPYAPCSNFHSIWLPITTINTPKARFKPAGGRRCAAFTPKGANSTVHTPSTTMHGTYQKPTAPAGSPGTFQPESR